MKTLQAVSVAMETVPNDLKNTMSKQRMNTSNQGFGIVM